MTGRPQGAPNERPPLSRRGFLAAGAALVGASAAGCSSGTNHPTVSTTTQPPATTTTTSATQSGDIEFAGTAASIEVLVINTCRAGLAAAANARLGAVPAPLTTFLTAAMGNHQAALDRWNAMLSNAGLAAVNQPPATLQADTDRVFARVTDSTALARLILQLEQTASDTYLSAIPMLASRDAVMLAAQLQSVDQEHAAMLHYLVGSYPVPDTFQNTNHAFSG